MPPLARRRFERHPLATFEPSEMIAIDPGGRGKGGGVGLPAGTAVAMSNRPIQLVDFVLHRSAKTASLHGIRSTLGQIIFAHAFQNSLHLIEETPERFNSASASSTSGIVS